MPGASPESPDAVPPIDWRGLWLCAAIHLVAALGLCWHAVASGFTRVVGTSAAEVWAFLWGHFWLEQSLLEQHRWPFRTTLVDHPTGGVLWIKDPVMLVLMLPVQWLAGIPAAYMVSMLLLFVLAGVGLFLLARLLGLGRWPALLAALTFAFAPHSLGEAYNGNMEALNTCWLPLWLWAMLRVLRLPRAGPVVAAAVALWLLLLANQYWALAMAAVSLPVVAQQLWCQRGQGPGTRRALLALGAAVAAGLVLFSPAAWAILSNLGAADKINAPFVPGGTVPLNPPYLSDALHLVRPLAPLTWQTVFPPFQDIVYPGLLVLAAAAAAPLLGPSNAWRWWGIAGGVLFLVLSLGPALSWDGRLVGHPDTVVWLPWQYLVPQTPLLSSMTLPHRMAVPAALFLSLGLGFSLQGLWPRWRGRLPLGAAAAVLLALAALAEILLYPPYRIPLATTEVMPADHARLLRRLQQPGAVLNLPFDRGTHDQRVFLWHQTVHRRPIGQTLRTTEPPSIVGRIPLLWNFAGPLGRQRLEQHDPASRPGDPHGVVELRRAGYGYLAVHGSFLKAGAGESLRAWAARLDPVLGQGLVLREGVVLYALDRTARPKLVAAARASLPAGAVLGSTSKVYGIKRQESGVGPRDTPRGPGRRAGKTAARSCRSPAPQRRSGCARWCAAPTRRPPDPADTWPGTGGTRRPRIARQIDADLVAPR